MILNIKVQGWCVLWDNDDAMAWLDRDIAIHSFGVAHLNTIVFEDDRDYSLGYDWVYTGTLMLNKEASAYVDGFGVTYGFVHDLATAFEHALGAQAIATFERPMVEVLVIHDGA